MGSSVLDTVIRIDPDLDNLLPVVIFCDADQVNEVILDKHLKDGYKVSTPTIDEYNMALYSEWKALLETYLEETPDVHLVGID